MRTAWRCFFVLIAAFSGVSFSYAGVNAVSPVKSDERVIFFPTAARLSEDGTSWLVPVHGWIFEPEEDGFFRGVPHHAPSTGAPTKICLQT